MNTKTVVINGERINYDGSINYSILADEVIEYNDSTPEEVIERIQGAGIVVSKEYPLPKEMIDQFPDTVHLLCEAGTGFNNIDLAAAKARGITVTHVPSYSTERVAHTAMLMALNLASSMRKQIGMLKDNDHRNFTDRLLVPHVELNDKVMGIIGGGHIGMEVAKLAVAFGMKVLVYDLFPKEDTEQIKYAALEDVIKNSDFISLHCPLNKATYHLIGEKELAMMKNSAFVINTARGPLIDEKAIIHALENGIIAGAGLDVQEIEPPCPDNPLYTLENVILTPHMGWRGLETRKRLVDLLANNIKSYIAGNPINVVNK